MTDSIMTKHQVVMDLDQSALPEDLRQRKSWVRFKDEQAETDSVEWVYLTLGNWEDMGRPMTITVGIELGDKLNPRS